MRIVVTKGDRPRTIRIPVALALEIRLWIDGKRKTYAHRYRKENDGSNTDRLFLSDHKDGHWRPISGQTVYRCFSEVKPHPPHWSPHKGRHAFACFWVMHALSTDAKRDGGLSSKSADWVHGRGDFWMKMLQRQFGHVSLETTEEYLRWLVFATQIVDLASGWHRFLEGGSE
jgi:integrase